MVSSLTMIEPVEETGHGCSMCGKPLELGEEIAILTVGFPTAGQIGVTPSGPVEGFIDIEPLESMEEGEDKYLYEPHLFHRECWKEIESDWEADIADKKPVFDNRQLIECDLCTSCILVGETTGVVRIGRLAISNRRPHGSHSLTLSETAEAEHVCVACLAGINEDHLEMWDEGISHDNACEQGVKERCWRRGCEHSCKYQDLYCPNCNGTNIDRRPERYQADAHSVPKKLYSCNTCHWQGTEPNRLEQPDNDDDDEEEETT